jgi:hypothetical protein
MYKIMLALHLLTAVFAIGPLVWAAKTAGRGVRRGDVAEIASASRVLKWYSIASVLVVIFGFAVMSAKPPFGNAKHTAEFSDTYIWLSLVLWIAAVGVAHGALLPQLEKITAKINNGESSASFTWPIAIIGGLISVIFVVIIFLMVYRPGS